MRISDAPPAGWYPDPESRTRLRWWDGLDWTDIRRAPPSAAELSRSEAKHAAQAAMVAAAQQAQPQAQPQQYGGYSRQEAADIIAEVRNVARSELDRAAEQFSERATTAVRSVTPLISEYTSKFFRYLRLAIGLAVALFVLWLVLQAIASQSLFDWIGDRIDNLTDDTTGGTLIPFRPPT